MEPTNPGDAQAPELPRPLAPEEKAVLLALLNHADFDSRDELVTQVDEARVIGRCECGCATVELAVGTSPSDEAVQSPIPNQATVIGTDGTAIGGVLVLVKDGLLSELEVYSYDETPIDSPPPTERLRLEHLPGP